MRDQAMRGTHELNGGRAVGKLIVHQLCHRQCVDRFLQRFTEGMRKRLQSKGIKIRESIVPRTGDTQFFLYDPDGVGVELNFAKS